MGKKSRKENFTVDPEKYIERLLKKGYVNDIPRFYETLASYSNQFDFCVNLRSFREVDILYKSIDMQKSINSDPKSSEVAQFISLDSINKISLNGAEFIQGLSGTYRITPPGSQTITKPCVDRLVKTYLAQTCITKICGDVLLGFEDIRQIPVSTVQGCTCCFSLRVPIVLSTNIGENYDATLVDVEVCPGLLSVQYGQMPKEYTFMDFIVCKSEWIVQTGAIFFFGGQFFEYLFNLPEREMTLYFTVPQHLTKMELIKQVKAIKYGQALYGKVFGISSCCVSRRSNRELTWRYKFIPEIN